MINECSDWNVDIMGKIETHMRDVLEMIDQERKDKFKGKRRQQQNEKFQNSNNLTNSWCLR